MGFWAKDGSYQYDEHDLRIRESMNETQGQYYERQQRGIAAMKRYQDDEKRRQAAEREWLAKLKEEDREAAMRAAQERQKEVEKMQAQQKTQENRRRYGTDFDLRNPEDLSDRRARANYWRIQNNFCSFVNYVTGKSERYYKLSKRFSEATTEEEKLKIVEEMERMFPTRELAIRRIERKTGFRK